MPVTADRRSPRPHSDWEPQPLQVPAPDCYGEAERPEPDGHEGEGEKPAGSHVFVIELA